MYYLKSIHSSQLTFTLKDILLECELNFTDVAAVLIIDVSSVFFVATAVKIDVTAAKADATAVKTDGTAAKADATAAITACLKI